MVDRDASPSPGSPAVAGKRHARRAGEVSARMLWIALAFCLAVLGIVYSLQSGRGALVVYNYHPRSDDPEYTNNFLYFVREGIVPEDGNDYVVVLQQDDGTELPVLPPLPANGRYVRHANQCFDLGTIGWLLQHHVHPMMYRHFVFLNSGVRGPFLPGWARRERWVQQLTGRLKGRVRMVGPTINCGGAFDEQPLPHVQTYTFAVDYKGLRVLQAAGVFACFRDWRHAIVDGELGAAKAIFEAGYTIDSLMLRYQGVDWSDPAMQGCNAGRQAIQDGLYDGISVHPLEVMFIKVKHGMLEAGWSNAQAAARYDAWADQARLPPEGRAQLLRTNKFESEADRRLAEMAKRADCFDADFYIRTSFHDLKSLLEAPNVKETAWHHFVLHGFKEGRTHRFAC